MHANQASDLGSRWLAVVGGGFVGGALAAAGLALPWRLGLLASLTGGSGVSSAVALAGYGFAVVAALGAGFVAGRPATRASSAGSAAGAIGGYVAYAVVGGATATVVAGAPLWAAATTGPTEAEGLRQLAVAVPALFAAHVTWLIVLVAAGAGLGACGGLLASFSRRGHPDPVETPGLTALGSASVGGGITNALVAIVVALALPPLVANVLAQLASDSARSLVAPAMIVAPIAVYLATGAVLHALGARAAREAARHVESPEGRRQGWFVALVGVGVPVAALGIAATGAPGGGEWLAAYVVTAALAVLMYGTALRTAAADPRPGRPEVETRVESFAAGFTDTLALWNPTVALSLHVGVGAAVAIVPWIPALTGQGPPPDPSQAIGSLSSTVTMASALVLFLGPLALALAHRGTAALTRRRAQG